HVVAIDDIDGAVLSCAHEQVRMRAWLVRQQNHSTGVQVEIVRVQKRLIFWREEVRDPSAQIEPHEAVGDIRTARVEVERAVPGGEIQVADSIDHQTSTTLPDAASLAIG